MMALGSQTLPILAADCVGDALMNALKRPVLAIPPPWLQTIVMGLKGLHEYAQYPLKI